ncbi:MAG: YqeG family HAD IIIA-type phosphatase [Pirellulales bacterium]|nr:YqeG family HAD IIIA-type phosphatase [Pirellulales bacterium]
MPSIFRPDLRLHRVEQIDVALLRRLHIDALLLDVDCTLKPYRSQALAQSVVDWIGQLRREGIGLCLVSNGRGTRVRPIAERLDLPLVAAALKPLPHGCRAAIARMEFDPRRTAMVGDQLFTDVMAGRLAGIFTILVDPIRPEQEPWYTRLKRPVERFLVRGVAHRPRGEEPSI